MEPNQEVCLRLLQEAYYPQEAADIESEPLARLLVKTAIMEEVRDRDQSLKREETLPGYLKRIVGSESQICVYVPANLAYVSPTGPQLELLAALAGDFILRPQHDICLSGSATFLGRTSNIDDIDFAEYFSYRRHEVLDYIKAYPGRSRAARSKITSFKIEFAGGRGVKFRREKPPFRNCLDEIGRRIWKDLYFGGFGELAELGLKKVSNKVFPSAAGEKNNDNNMYQEIMILGVAQSGRPRSLAVPKNFENYLFRLKNDAREFLYEKKKPIKALKRAISITLLLGLRYKFHQGIDLLPDSNQSEYDRAEIRTYINNVLNEVRYLETRAKPSMGSER